MFRFNFSKPEEGDKKDTVESNNEAKADISWFEAKEHFKHKDESGGGAGYIMSNHSFQVTDDLVLPLVDSATAEKVLRDENPENYGMLDNSDLKPGVYEGGLKIWECSEDLARYLKEENLDFKGKKVLELGCGAALPALVTLALGSERVDFQDYNPEVIERITIPNACLNNPDMEDSEEVIKEEDESGGTPESKVDMRFFSGDWASFTKLVADEANFKPYDLILTSETIYNIDNQEKLLQSLDKLLASDGVVFLAAKVHYFGVGGGLRQFEGELAKKKVWDFQTVKVIDAGLKREILKITRKK